MINGLQSPLFEGYHNERYSELKNARYNPAFNNWNSSLFRGVSGPIISLREDMFSMTTDQINALYATVFFIGGIYNYGKISKALCLGNNPKKVIAMIAEVLFGCGIGTHDIDDLELRLSVIQNTWCRKFRNKQFQDVPARALSLRRQELLEFDRMIGLGMDMSQVLGMWESESTTWMELQQEVGSHFQNWIRGDPAYVDEDDVQKVSMDWSIDSPPPGFGKLLLFPDNSMQPDLIHISSMQIQSDRNEGLQNANRAG